MKKLLLVLIAILGFATHTYAQINVNQGGTGKLSFPINSWIYADNGGLQRLGASSSPTVGYITGTSTATSTFQGGFSASQFCLSGSPTICLTATGSGTTIGTISTSSPAVRSGLLYFTTQGSYPELVASVATTSVTCSGTVTCSAFTAIGASPISINGSAGTSASSTLLGDNNSFTGKTDTFTNASTTLLTLNGLVYDITNSKGTNGFILESTANGTLWVATTTFSTGLLYSNGVVTNTGILSLTNGTGIFCSGNPTGSCSFSNQPGNSVLTNQAVGNGVPSGEATSTFGNTLYQGVAASSTVLISNGTTPIFEKLATSQLTNDSGFNSGTVTSVATNAGLTGGTINTTGTIGLDVTSIINGLLLQYNGTRLAATGTPSLTVGYIIATSTTASQLPYASTTVTSATSLCLSTDCRTVWPSGSGSSSVGPINTLQASDGAGGFLATGTPSLTAAYFIATTTTSTTTLQGTVLASAGGSVGIGTTTTTGDSLSVKGNAYISGNLGVGMNPTGGSALHILAPNGQGGIDVEELDSGSSGLAFKASNAAFTNSVIYANTVRTGSTVFKLLDLRTNNGTTNTANVDGNGNSFFAGEMGVATATPRWELEVASSTRPQLALTSANGVSHWTFRNAGGNLYVGTANDLTWATGTPAFTILSGGNTGIGTSTPGSLFSIQGVANLQTGTSTFLSGIDLPAGGCVAVGGVCLGTGGGSGSGTVGNGVAGQLAFYNTSGTSVQGSSTQSLTIGQLFATSTATSTFGGPVSLSLASTTATSTLAGINLPYGGCVAVAGTCLTSNTGTVTSVATNAGLTGGTITGAGTVGLDTSSILNGTLLQYNGTRLAATGTPSLTVGYIISTSTATSTFAGGISAPNFCLSGTPTTCLGGSSGGGSGSTLNIDLMAATSSIFAGPGNYVYGTSTSEDAGGKIQIWMTASKVANGSTYAITVHNSQGTTTIAQHSMQTTGTGPTYNDYGQFNATTTGKLDIYLTDGAGTIIDTTSAIVNFSIMYLRSNGTTVTGGGSSSGNSFAFPFFPVANGNATNTPISFFGGLITQGSTTIPYASTTAVTIPTLYDSTNSAGASSTILISNGTKDFWQKLATSQITNDSGFVTSSGVTSVATNNGLTGGTITTTGTLGLDLTRLVPGALTIWNGAQLQATGTPSLTIGYLIATSTTATSTFANTVSIGSSTPSGNELFSVGSSTATTLTVDKNTGFVGIGTSSPVVPFVLAQTGNLLTTDFVIDGVSAGAGAEMALNRANTSGTEANIDFNTAGVEEWQLGIQNNNTNNFEIWDGSDSPFFTINQGNGDVGIGTSTPYSELTVWGEPGTNLLELVNSASSTKLTVDQNGNFGLGSTSPGSIFAIQNVLNAKVGTSTWQGGGIDFVGGGCVAINGTCIGGGSGGGSGTVGSGVTGQLAFYNTSGTSIVGSSSASVTVGSLFATSTTATSTIAGGLIVGNNCITFDPSVSTTTLACGVVTGNFMADQDAGMETLYNLPIVNAAFNTPEGFDLELASRPVIQLRCLSNGLGDCQSMRVAIGTSSPAAQFEIFASSTLDNLFQVVSAASTTLAVINSTGNLGIGTSSPYANLSVVGTTNDLFTVATSSTGYLYSIDSNGHHIYSGSKPTCDANCTFVFGNDNVFYVKAGTAITTTVVTFANSWGGLWGPACAVSDGGAITTFVDASSTPTNVTLTPTTALTGTILAVNCTGMR